MPRRRHPGRRHAQTPPEGRRSRWLVAAAVAALALALVLCQVLTGTPPLRLAAWVAAVLCGVLVPGFVVVRALSARPHAALDELAWSVPTGVCVALLGWLADPGTPGSLSVWVWGPGVTLTLLCLPSVRLRALRRPAQGDGTGPAIALVAVFAVATTWSTADYLARTPWRADEAGANWHPDTQFQLALVHQLSRQLSPENPMVDGEPVAYHWFTHAAVSHLTTGSWAGPDVVVLRLLPVSLLLALLLVVAAAARRLSGDRWVGALAAGILGVSGPTVATFWSVDGFGPPLLQTSWWSNPTQTLGSTFAVALLAAVTEALRTGASSGLARLSLPWVVAAVGVKATILPLLGCGVALAVVVALLRRRSELAVRGMVLGLLIVTVVVLAALTLYGGGSYGLRVAAFSGVSTFAAPYVPGLARWPEGRPRVAGPVLPPGVTASFAVAWLGPSLLRWMGLVPLALRRGADPATYVVLGTCAAGLAATLGMRHPGSSEILFLATALPVGAVGSAAGLATLRQGAPCVWRAGAAGGVLGSVAACVVALFAGPELPSSQWQRRFGGFPTAEQLSPGAYVLLWTTPLLVLCALVLASVLAAYLLVRRTGARRGAIAVFAAGAVLGTGLLSTGLAVFGSTQPSTARIVAQRDSTWPPGLTDDHLKAAAWLRENSEPDDVVATNRQCVTSDRQRRGRSLCDARGFWVSAFGGRQVLLEGWAYTSEVVERAWLPGSVQYTLLPFRDQRLVESQRAAFQNPTRRLLDRLYERRGVRWLVADMRGTRVSPLLDVLAQRRYSSPGAVVWELYPGSEAPSR